MCLIKCYCYVQYWRRDAGVKGGGGVDDVEPNTRREVMFLFIRRYGRRIRQVGGNVGK